MLLLRFPYRKCRARILRLRKMGCGKETAGQAVGAELTPDTIIFLMLQSERIEPAPAVLRLGRTWLSESFGGGFLLFLPWLARLVGLPNGRVAADESPLRTDDGRVVRDFKLERTAREV